MNPDKNDSDEKREYRDWLGSLAIHVVIFAIVCFTGLFVVVSPPQEQPLDVSLYDADAGLLRRPHRHRHQRPRLLTMWCWTKRRRSFCLK